MDLFFSECRALGIPAVDRGFHDYLRDESRFRGTASGLVRAREERHVTELLKLANRLRVPITVVSGKTSITGACVPLGGIVLDVRGLDTIAPDDPTRVGPGVIVTAYKHRVHELGFFYPPDPTSEDSCTIGGNVACNASGALSYRYGPTRDFVRGLRVALPTGEVLDVDRGRVLSSRGEFRIPKDAWAADGPAELVVPAPKHGARPWSICKSAAGLYSHEPNDLVDLFIGSEGILGVILEVRTVLVPRRNPFFALMLTLSDREVTVDLVRFLDVLKRCRVNGEAPRLIRTALGALLRCDEPPTDSAFRGIVPACMEWFGRSVAELLEGQRARRTAAAYGSLYVEQEVEPHEDPLDVAAQWAELVELVNARRTVAGRIIETEVALDAKHIRALRDARRHIPERLNELIKPGMVKVGLDFAVPMAHLDALLTLYEHSLPPGTSYVFGHIGNAHLHANVLPDSDQELERFNLVYREMVTEVCRLGGTVSGEHGIGKLKREALEMMLGSEGVEEIKRIKALLDPNRILNIGTMVELT